VAWADDDDCKPRGRRCTRNRQCCSKNCINNPSGSGKVCGCPTGKTPCQGRCVTNCTSPKVLDTNTCECVCPGSCEGGQVFNANCQCECPTGQVLCNDACVSNVCDAGEVFNPTTCQCGACSPAGNCFGGGFPECGNGCVCVQTLEGTGFCAAVTGCLSLQTCTITADCPTGHACSESTCCAERVCLPPCAGTGGLAAARGAGPTIVGA
jgi:hypothetical protein